MYICDLCNYKTYERGNFNRHNKTKKHNLYTSDHEELQQKLKKNEDLRQKILEAEKNLLETKKNFRIKK